MQARRYRPAATMHTARPPLVQLLLRRHTWFAMFSVMHQMGPPTGICKKEASQHNVVESPRARHRCLHCLYCRLLLLLLTSHLSCSG